LEVNILELGKWISKKEAVMLLEITNDCLSCNSRDDLDRLSGRFKGLVSSEYFLTGHMNPQQISSGNMHATSINSGFPDEYLIQYTDNSYPLIDPLYHNFIETLNVQHSEDLERQYMDGEAQRVLNLNLDFGISNITFYGIRDFNEGSIDCFYFGGPGINNKQRNSAMAKYMLPFFSTALRHLIYKKIKTDSDTLTTSELEILKWLKEGKSSWEISMILNRSERVVNFHTSNILKKLDANNRSHAVAIALKNNLLTL
jgi:LuxR family transcriptional regulator, quorum-sensing system regulator CviR